MTITVKDLLIIWVITIILIPITIIATIFLLPISYQNNILGLIAIMLIVTLTFVTFAFLIFSIMMLIDKSNQELIEQGVKSHKTKGLLKTRYYNPSKKPFL
ncbi:hypothetical protein D3Z30_11805 [Staphylococcus warneri]|uniref:Uncharacterized protein n=1 Tax=Staphylococcus warneri TaxID=1292 RepID=A0AB36BJE7_STAWA|nr:hypothetical protein [Staphylococcus warneri]